MRKKTEICCLPIAGTDNPYQLLMMEGLRKNSDLVVIHGHNSRVFPLVLTCIFKRPDVIHNDWINSYYTRNNPVLNKVQKFLFWLDVILFKFLFKTKLVWTIHNIYPHDNKSIEENRLRSFFASKCDRIRVFSENTARHVISEFGIDLDKIWVVPEGSYLGYYKNEISTEEARHRMGFSGSNLVLLYLGNIRPYKGLENLVEKFKLFKRSNWRLVIAGKPFDDIYAKKISELSMEDNSIRLDLKFIVDNDLQEYFNAADIVVLPFENIENSGSVILAMGFGKAIITKNQGAVSRRLAQQSGLLYEENIVEVFQSIEKIPKNKFKVYGQSNLKKLEENKWEDFQAVFTEYTK